MTRTTTVLLRDAHVSWHSSEGPGRPAPRLHGRGYATVEGLFREGQGLVDAVAEACLDEGSGDPADRLRKLIPSLNGHWALVARWPDGSVLAATDRTRGIPLFYTTTPTQFVVAATAADAQRQRDSREIDEVAAAEFLVAGFTTGNSTLYKDVHKLQPGEIVEFDGGAADAAPRSERYYHFLPRGDATQREEELEEEFEAVCDVFFATVVESADKGRFVVPLSGGLDSRLVAAMLKKHGVDDAVCYSYGEEGTREPAVSRQVAEALGYEWRFVEYSGEEWARWTASREMREYWRYGSKGASLPHFQDLPAVLTLAEKGLLPQDPIFFPGHTGDMLSGAEEVLRNHYWLWPLDALPSGGEIVSALREKVSAQCSSPPSAGNVHPASRYEMWDAENRQGLFIINSVRAYEYLSGRWRTLWDYGLMDFFAKVPMACRLGKRLYVNALRKRVLTGPAAKLTEVPIASFGADGELFTEWTDDLSDRYQKKPKRKSLRSRAKGVARNVLSRLGLFEAALSIKRRKSTVRSCWHPESWFAGGRDPRSLTVRQALDPFQTLEKLPAAVLPCVEARLKRRLDLMSFNGMLSAVVLGELCAPAAGEG
jgi:asparagine synthase (glutamine-hydrolysing)